MEAGTAKSAKAQLTLGPLLYHWDAEKRRDFYFKIADEAPVDCVYLGEVICSKREPYFEEYFYPVADRLRSAGKQVVISTNALVTSSREMADIRKHASEDAVVEANDVACLQSLHGKPHVIGPFVNVFNEGAREFVLRNGAFRIVLPVEAPATSIKVLANTPAEIEVMVFGRQTLSVAMRCYHARSHGLTKDSCQFVCGLDPNGLSATTVTGEDLLTISGTSTQSHGYVVLLDELEALRKMGVTHFRVSPQHMDMVAVTSIYRDVLDGKRTPKEAEAHLLQLSDDIPFVNGFYYAREGLTWTEHRAAAV
jgi:O2-independent ubiquinone biosynthesis protein UbiV